MFATLCSTNKLLLWLYSKKGKKRKERQMWQHLVKALTKSKAPKIYTILQQHYPHYYLIYTAFSTTLISVWTVIPLRPILFLFCLSHNRSFGLLDLCDTAYRCRNDMRFGRSSENLLAGKSPRIIGREVQTKLTDGSICVQRVAW